MSDQKADGDHDDADAFAAILSSYDIISACESLKRYLKHASQSRRTWHSKNTFYEQIILLLDRIFGKDNLSRHHYGGWLSYSAQFPSNSSLSSELSMTNVFCRKQKSAEEISNLRCFNKLSKESQALVSFLSICIYDREEASLCQFLFRLHHSAYFRFELDMLPEQTKISILSQSPYVSVLFTQLLHTSSKHKVDMRRPELLLTAGELYLFYFFRYPSSTSGDSTLHKSYPRKDHPPPSILSSLPESLKPQILGRNRWQSCLDKGYVSLLERNPYNVLLLHYLECFLPDTKTSVANRFHANLIKHSNIFLYTLIEFYLRQNMIFFYEAALSDTCHDFPTREHGFSESLHENIGRQSNRMSPFSIVQTHTTYMAPSDDVLSSLVLTVIYLLSDSYYSAPSSMPTKHSHPMETLTPNVNVFQRPLYEFLRLVFSRAPIDMAPAAFHAITNVWLAYIQPWKCPFWVGKTENQMTYEKLYDGFVLANFHFYTVLLGEFVKRAREMDFCKKEGQNVALLEHAFGIYTPELLEWLDRGNRYLVREQERKGNGSDNRKRSTQIVEDLSAEEAQVLTFYRNALGIACVPVELHTAFHRDAERLYDKLLSDSGLYESGKLAVKNASDSDTRYLDRIQRCCHALRRIFAISDAYVAATTQTRPHSVPFSIDQLEPERDPARQFQLTARGRNQIKDGLRLCLPQRAAYIGDPMLYPIRSYEVAFLVRLLYRVSTWLNAKCGFENPYNGKKLQDNVNVDLQSAARFRFNLRFLSSKPNLLGLVLLALMLRIALK